MKVMHVVKTLAEEYGGPARSVQGLVVGLEACGVESWLVTFQQGRPPWIPGIKHFRQLQGDVKAAMSDLIDEIQPDLIQTHDLWMPPLHACVSAARSKGVPYIITPRGTLEVWSLKQKWWKKYPALWTYQGYDLRRALAIQSTAGSETTQCKKFCGKTPVFFSTNGVNMPSELPPRRLHEDGLHRAVFVSRIHKKKGLLNLVAAWAKARPLGWKMEIVGTDADGYQQVIEGAVRTAGLQDDFIFSGPFADERKWEAYRRADLFVFPTHSENFGIVVAEALYAGVPVITTKGAPWSDLESMKCGWWVDIGVKSLTAAIKRATELSDDVRGEMGMRGHDLVAEKYTWTRIAADLKLKYVELLKGLA